MTNPDQGLAGAPAPPGNGSPIEATAGLARFLHRAGGLKATKRTGWLDRDVPADRTESVADHTWRTALLAWLAASLDPSLNADRVTKLALLHDLAEAVTGDHPPYDPALIPAANPAARRDFLERHHVRPADRQAAKRAAEAAAMAGLLADLPPVLAEPLAALWQELEGGATAEARFVKQADKLETYLQSREHLAADPARPMASFAAEVAAVVDEPVLAALRGAIAALPIEPA